MEANEPTPINIQDILFSLISWSPPPYSWYKLNSDSSCRVDSGKIGADEPVRDVDGDWPEGFALNLGVGTEFEPKL